MDIYAVTKIADPSELSVAGPTYPGEKRRVPLITWLVVFPKGGDDFSKMSVW